MKRRRLFAVVVSLVALLLGLLLHFRRTRDVFADLDQKKTRAEIGNLMKELASRPHRAGTPENHAVGSVILARLRDAGLKTSEEEFEIEMPEPREARCVLTVPALGDLPAGERVLPEDPYSSVASQEFPYFAYSPDADVEAEVIYANYGSREDYEYIRNSGIDPSGKIALVRAQGICRGMKIRVAEEQGLAGLLVFPELKDQGFRKKPFPEGPHINPWVAQRGSLLKFFAWPGDPSQAPDPSAVLPRVPAIPVSQQAAVEILRVLAGPEAPADWKGWMDAPYRIGSGFGRVRMITRSQNLKRTFRNIFADIPADSEDAPIVMVGCHYDAWVYGASDPASGTAAVLETARILGREFGRGWRPSVRLRFAFWDAEEPGLFGSAAWVQANIDRVRGRLAAYINVDSAYRTPFFVGNLTPGMGTPLDEVLSVVRDPVSGTRLSEVRGEFRLPGFSSDAGPFLGFFGVPVAEIGFGAYYPMYHSTYDDLHWMENHADPGYKYHATLVQILGLYIRKWSDSMLLPYDFSQVVGYLESEVIRIRDADGKGPEWNTPAGLHFRRAQDAFQHAVRRWNDSRISGKEVQPGAAAEVNRLQVRAMETLRGLRPDSYGAGGLYGASEREGCPAFPLPGLQDAHMSGDLTAWNTELERISASLEKSALILSEAAERIRMK